MFVSLVVCLAISYANCDISVAKESEISFLKDKFLQMENIVTKQENRIAYLEETVLRQNTEMLNLNAEVSRLRPKILTLEKSLHSLKNILRRKILPKPRTMVNFVTKPEIKQDYNPSSVNRRENGKDKRVLLQGTQTVNSPIGFYAYLSQNEINPGIHHTIIFDVKITNVGDGYNSFSGMFTAPTDGLYAFAVSIIMIHEYASYELVKNNAVQGSMFVDAEHSGENRSSSMTAVLSLFHGDVVFVRTSSTYTPHGSIHSSKNGRSSFAGRCPRKSRFVYSEMIKSCFRIHSTNTALQYADFYTECDKEGAELMRIDSEEKQHLIVKYLDQFAFPGWIMFQGSRKLAENHWKYNDGSNITYFNWYQSQAYTAGAQNNTVVIGMRKIDGYKWHALPVTAKGAFLCEILVFLDFY